MNKTSKTWLLFMILPLIIGALMYILVPLLIISTSNLKLEQAFNGYKIQTQQNTVRSLSYMNSRILTNRLQMYFNIISTFVKLYRNDEISGSIDLNKIIINNAYELANQNSTDFIANRSMWYSPNVTSIQNMSYLEKAIFNGYRQMQPYVQATIDQSNEIYLDLKNLTVTINFSNCHFYFQYPSQIIEQFSIDNATIFSKYYYETIQNYKQKKFQTTTFKYDRTLRICNVIYYVNDPEPNAVVCIDLDTMAVTKDSSTIAQKPQFQLSTYNYYYVIPSYSYLNETNPQIISNFSSQNLSNINVPKNKQTFSLENNTLPPEIFKGDRNYSMNIQRLQRTKTFFTIPISTSNYMQNNDIGMYMIVLNNFEKAQFAEESRNQRIAIIMIVPSVLLLVFMIFVTTFVLYLILKKLREALSLMEQYCSLIKRGDLELDITQYEGSKDLKILFDQIRKLNNLCKYSNYSYFNVPKPQRIVKLLQCQKLFDELSYNKANLYENISQCYVYIGDIRNAIKIFKKAIKIQIQCIYGNQEKITALYNAKVNKQTKKDKTLRKKQRSLKRKILRFCQVIFMLNQNLGPQEQRLLVEKAELLRKISYPDILNYEYICCLMIIMSFKIKNREFTQIQSKMEIIYELIKGYSQVNDNELQCQIPPNILFSYWHSMMGHLYLLKQQFVLAYQHFVSSLRGNRFHSQYHLTYTKTIQKLLQITGIPPQQISDLRYLEQYRPRLERQYIFLLDVSNPKIKLNRINRWKKKTRKMAEHIFDQHIKQDDRVSIIQFCINIKIVCNLVEKSNREKLLKKQLMSSIKAREQTIIPQLVFCLNKTIERVKYLKKEKIFLIFSKQNESINGIEISQQFDEIQNKKVIFLLEDTNIFYKKAEDIFCFDLQNFCHIDRILEQKVIKHADNTISIF